MARGHGVIQLILHFTICNLQLFFAILYGRLTGMMKLNVLPLPGSLSTRILPP